MRHWFDGALYADMDPPADLATLAAKVDFLARLCAAADFGLLPWPQTVDEIRQPTWRAAVDGCGSAQGVPPSNGCV